MARSTALQVEFITLGYKVLMNPHQDQLPDMLAGGEAFPIT